MDSSNTGIFLLVLLTFAALNSDVKADSHILMSRQHILEYLLDESRYESNIVPDFNKEEATKVSIQLTVSNMHSISETSMDYSVDLFLRQIWLDERLNFTNNGTQFDKLEVDHKNIDRVWHPDTYFRNEKKASFHTVTTNNELMHIYVNGTVVYSMRLSMTLICFMLLQKYPFDTQTCPIYVQSFGYTLDNIDLFWREYKPMSVDHVELPQFLLHEEVTNSRIILHHQTGAFSCLKAEMKIQRKVAFFFLNVFIPSVLLVILSWVSFWVDPNAVPARVTLGVTCVLTLTTQSSGIRQSLPPVSYVKAIDVWMFVCLIFVFGALLEFAYVNILQRSDRHKADKIESGTEEANEPKDEKATPSDEDEGCFNRALSKVKLTCFKDRKTMTGHEKAKQVDIISRFLFPITFMVFLIIYSLVCALIPDPTTDTIVGGV